MPILADMQRLEPGGKVRLYELDATRIGGDLLRFHPYPQSGSIWWQDNEYTAWAVQIEGIERSAQGTAPRPRLTVGNIGMGSDGEPIAGIVSAMCIALDDLIGADVIFRCTLAQYLDDCNFQEGNPSADATEEFPPELWKIEQKNAENPDNVEFLLVSPLDFDNVRLPRRQIMANVCSWLGIGGSGYRGPDCGYTGALYFDRQDNPVSDPALDRCRGLLCSCKKRWGENEELPFGSFPGADLTRV
ncbi:phage minor tail protein L [Silvimonas soli]|uniref:phage minor tail protein L n=1 Tax=Silvimonas soli TaxID=2980100 RepID=UPI0024B3C0DC|nr:phage minor tail protein L [Silvimonas soli]